MHFRVSRSIFFSVQQFKQVCDGTQIFRFWFTIPLKLALCHHLCLFSRIAHQCLFIHYTCGENLNVCLLNCIFFDNQRIYHHRGCMGVSQRKTMRLFYVILDHAHFIPRTMYIYIYIYTYKCTVKTVVMSGVKCMRGHIC